LQELLEYTMLAVEKDPSYEDSSCHVSADGDWDAEHDLQQHDELSGRRDEGNAYTSVEPESAPGILGI
jgi:hypothetical protein